MRLSLSATTALLLVSSGSLAFASASANAEPRPDTAPDSTPTKTTRQVKARETTTNLLGALYQLATNLHLRACVPRALPLVTALPRIPPGLLAGDAVAQALSQTTRALDAVCDFSVTGPGGDAFTSFLPAWYAWYHQHSDRIAGIVAKCPDAAGLVKTIEAYEGCPQVAALLTAADAGVDTSATGTAADTIMLTPTPASTEPVQDTSTDSPSTTHEAGFLGAAVAAAAGVLGVVAVL